MPVGDAYFIVYTARVKYWAFDNSLSDQATEAVVRVNEVLVLVLVHFDCSALRRCMSIPHFVILCDLGRCVPPCEEMLREEANHGQCEPLTQQVGAVRE